MAALLTHACVAVHAAAPLVPGLPGVAENGAGVKDLNLPLAFLLWVVLHPPDAYASVGSHRITTR